ANKLLGIRAAPCHDAHADHRAVEHDDANVPCLAGQIGGERLALDLVRTFLAARFAEETIRRRPAKVSAIERLVHPSSAADV
ncbi:MAG: RpiB/LacA/LacB family sugar-phosphate isomerase, partial [Chloroflexota bacterium]|nr:RpiB/LacA/LacB family sugar-phosphate isomerase [Chloroflexota bacterium]